MISEVELKFNERVVRTIMHEGLFFGVLLRNGGKPKDIGELRKLDGEERDAVNAFEAFIE